MNNIKTRQELINEINSEITVGGKLPCYLNEQELNRIIDQSILFFRKSDKRATQPLSWIIKKEFFRTPAFERSRKLILPDNIISVNEFKEIRNTFQTQDANIKVASELYLSSITGSYDLVMSTVIGAYQNIANAQFLDKIQFNYNPNTNTLIVEGRTPIHDVIISTIAYIEDNKIFNEYYFIRYCAALAKQSVATLFSAMEFNLPGGVKINPTKYEQMANDEIREIQEKIKRLNPPNWMIID